MLKKFHLGNISQISSFTKGDFNDISRYLPAIVIFVVVVLATYPLLKTGFFPTHDGEYHVIRFYEFHKVLSEGALYPRWAPDLNYGRGVPLFNYVYPLPNYAASFLVLLGSSFTYAFQLQMIIATFIGVLGMFLWSRQHWGQVGGLVSAVVYTFTPYRFVDIYVRGSVGEVWALAFAPLLLWSLIKFSKEQKLKYLFCSVILWALLIFSHNILALMFSLFAGSYILFLLIYAKHWRRLLYKYLGIILLALGLSAVFWIPANFEKDFVRGLQIYEIEENFPEVFQLIFPSWGSGFSGQSISEQMSFQIGVVNLLVVLLAFVFTIRGKKKKLSVFALIWFFFSLFLMLRISLPIWEMVPLISYFQFPWRVLSLLILLCAFLAGYVAYYFTVRGRFRSGIIVGIAISVLAIITTIGYAKPAHYFNRTDAYYFSRENFIYGTNSPGNLFNTKWGRDFSSLPRPEYAEYSSASGSLKLLEKSTSYLQLESNFSVEQDVHVNISYFPGWEVYIDGRKINAASPHSGEIDLSVPAGRHVIEVFWGTTIVRIIAETISVASVLVFLGIIIKSRYATIK